MLTRLLCLVVVVAGVRGDDEEAMSALNLGEENFKDEVKYYFTYKLECEYD